MSRRDAVLCLAVAIFLVVAGLAWLLGPWVLIASGISLAATVLFVVDVPDREDSE